MMLDRCTPPYRRWPARLAARPVLGIACGAAEAGAAAGRPAGGEDVARQGSLDTDETAASSDAEDEGRTRGRPQGLSPFAGRTYPTHVYSARLNNHTANRVTLHGGQHPSPSSLPVRAGEESCLDRRPVKLSRPLDFRDATTPRASA